MKQTSAAPLPHAAAASGKPSFFRRLYKDIMMNKWTYILAVPVIAYYIIFHYGPLYGALIAFKDFSPAKGILGSQWVGFKHFIDFFSGVYFQRVVFNTIAISFWSILFGFPAPILLALLLDEIRSSMFRRTVQTVTYLPHFISMVVVCGMITDFCSRNGLIGDVIQMLNPGFESYNLLSNPNLFRTIYIASDIWQGIGWGSIVYLAALSGVDAQLYEAVTIDGGNRFHKVWHVSLPSILPTIIILFIMRIGSLMSVGFEKIILLYSPATYQTADVISSFVYRRGLLEFSYSYSAAVGLFNNIINFILVCSANAFSRKVTETSLW